MHHRVFNDSQSLEQNNLVLMCTTTSSEEPAEADVPGLHSPHTCVVWCWGIIACVLSNVRKDFKQFHLFLHVHDAEPGVFILSIMLCSLECLTEPGTGSV